MTKKAEIKSIIIDLSDTEIKLTLKQAKELHKALDELFCEKTTTIIPSPFIIEKQTPYWQYPYGTWCSSDNELEVSYSTNDQTINMNLCNS